MKSEVAVVLTEDESGRWEVVEAEVPVVLAADWRARKLTMTMAMSFGLHCHLPTGGRVEAWAVGTRVARLDWHCSGRTCAVAPRGDRPLDQRHSSEDCAGRRASRANRFAPTSVGGLWLSPSSPQRKDCCYFPHPPRSTAAEASVGSEVP